MIVLKCAKPRMLAEISLSEHFFLIAKINGYAYGDDYANAMGL